MGKKRRGRTVRKNRSQMKNREEEFKSAPHTMIFTRGQVGNLVRCLAKDMRTMFEPFTATKLEVKRKNMLKDFVSIAGKLHVSHLIYFTRPPVNNEDGSSAIYMRMAKLPQGPTLTFRVLEYALRKNVQSTVHRTASGSVYQHPPLQVLQGFSGDGLHLKLVTSMVQNLLPPLNVRTLKLKTVRRVLLWSRADAGEDAEVTSPEELKEGDVIHLRHYSLKVGTRGLSRPLKRLQRKKVPNLAGYADVREWVTKGGALSDSGLSDAESCTDNEVEVPPSAGLEHRVVPGAKASVRAQEVGPRLTLQLIKAEAGLCSGEVLFHRFVTKTAAERRALEAKNRAKRRLKAQRKRQQEEAVAAKKAAKEEHKRKCLAGMGLSSEGADDEEEEDEEDEEEEVEEREEEFEEKEMKEEEMEVDEFENDDEESDDAMDEEEDSEKDIEEEVESEEE